MEEIFCWVIEIFGGFVFFCDFFMIRDFSVELPVFELFEIDLKTVAVLVVIVWMTPPGGVLVWKFLCTV